MNIEIVSQRQDDYTILARCQKTLKTHCRYTRNPNPIVHSSAEEMTVELQLTTPLEIKL